MLLLPEPWRKSRPFNSQEGVFFFSPSLSAFLLALNVFELQLQLRLIQDPAVTSLLLLVYPVMVIASSLYENSIKERAGWEKK